MAGYMKDLRATMCSAMASGQCHEEGELIAQVIGENQEEGLLG